MTDPYSAKVAKKLAKAAAKARKKQATAPDHGQPGSPSAAERSATAAEQQLLIRRRQMWISLVGVLAALLTVVIALTQCSPRK